MKKITMEESGVKDRVRINKEEVEMEINDGNYEKYMK